MPSRLIAVGVSHHSVPIKYREMVALSAEETKALLRRIKEQLSDEALVISTCNRSEIYARVDNEHSDADLLIDHLFDLKEVPAAERLQLQEQFSKLTYGDAILHLFEVTTGIDSQVFGDQQIFTQIKDSFRLAEEVGSAGPFMSKLSQAAFRVAKRVRNETKITEGAGTISYAAVEFARKVYDDLRNRTALIIGAGETAELSISYLLERNIGTVYVANRSLEHAEILLRSLHKSFPSLEYSKALSLSDMASVIPETDIIISSTASPEFVLRKKELEQALGKRQRSTPLVIVDIAVPRDIDPAIGSLPNVFLKDIDDLSSIVDQNLTKRKAEIPKIKAIISEEFNSFVDLFAKLEAGPTIAELRKLFERIRQEELERHKQKCSPETFAMLDEMTRKMMNRLLHTPTVMLKETSNGSMQERIELVRALFALDSSIPKDSE